MAENKDTIVMFPFMAQGHIIPFLALALQIQSQRKNQYSITFINTPLNIKKLRQTLPPDSSIDLLAIDFNSSDHGLPPHSENCDALPYNLVIKLLNASLSLRPAFKDIVSKIDSPLCIISDTFFGWTVDVARELGVFHSVFSGCGAFGLACYYSVWSHLPHRNVDSDGGFLLPDFEEASKLHKTQLALTMLEADGTDPWSVFQSKNLPNWVNSNGVLFNTVQAFDQLGLMYFKRKLNVPVWPIGPVLLSTDNRSKLGKNREVSTEFSKEWLDSKPEKSVLYISFGSMNTINKSQMMQLALALEASGRNFIWVVRPPIGCDINSEFKPNEYLPNGFVERVIHGSKRGLLIQNWAPQIEILSHKAISVFLSHCGWNSVLESLVNGVPLLGWAMAAEQFFNVKFLEEELGVCVEVARGKTCEVKYEDVVKKIEMVMDETSEKWKEIRRRVFEVKEMIENAVKDDEDCMGSSVKAMDEFFSAATSMKQGNSNGKLA